MIMKRILAFTVAVLLFILPVSAQTNEQNSVVLNFSDGITVCTPDSIPSVDGMIFGMNEDEFKNYLTENGIILYGLDNSNAFAFELTGEKTEFTENIKDFSYIKEADIKDFANSILGGDYKIKTYSKVSYIVTDTVYSDSDSPYIISQYITVKHGLLYVVTFTVPGEAPQAKTQERIEKVMNGLNFSGQEAPPSVSIYSIIGIAVLILAVLVVAVYLVITFVKDAKRKSNDSADTKGES